MTVETELVGWRGLTPEGVAVALRAVTDAEARCREAARIAAEAEKYASAARAVRDEAAKSLAEAGVRAFRLVELMDVDAGYVSRLMRRWGLTAPRVGR